jgi:hypothetical protein
MSTDRAPLSSVFAALAAITITAFTVEAIRSAHSLGWGVKLVVVWSFVLAAALLIWSLREVFHIHWIGHPTLAMVAGASGTGITAVALAFQLSAPSGHEAAVVEQTKALREQAIAIRELQAAIKDLQAAIQARPAPSGAASAATPAGTK